MNSRKFGRVLGGMVSASLLVLCALGASANSGQSNVHVIAAPDIQVDEEGGTAFGEPMAAASLSDRDYLLGAAMFFSPAGWNTRLFISHDRGYAWTMLTPPALIPIGQAGTGDVEVAFGPDSTAYYTNLGPNTQMPPGKQYGLWFFRSKDGGEAWQHIFIPGGYDHEQIAVDTSSSRFRGRVYLSVLANGVEVLHSADGGKSFTREVPVGQGFSAPPVVLSDGTLLVPVMAPKGKDARGESKPPSLDYALSKDGGVTFSKLQEISELYSAKDFEQRRLNGETDFDADAEVAQLAVDRSHGVYRDRIYAVWGDLRFHTSRLLLSYSADRAKTWSKPIIVGNDASPNAAQYQPAVAVAPNGTLGIAWFDTRDSGPHGYDEYFAASVDGGRTFLPSVRASSASSHPDSPGNHAFAPAGSDPYKQGIYVFLTSPRGRYVASGDYMGLSADAGNAFHPFWIDSRSGRNQVYTASLALGTSQPQPSVGAASLNKDVALIFDPGAWNERQTTLSLPVRLKNISGKPLYGPFTVTVVATSLPRQSTHDITAILNADNGKTGVGATFHYRDKLAGLTALPPGGVTEPMIWKLRLPLFSNQPTIGASVNGYLISNFPIAGPQLASSSSLATRE